jgi:hypothetical protein
MPLDRAEQFGTNASGMRINDYCSFCFREGHFTEPAITREEMIDKVAGFLVTIREMPEVAARSLARDFVPTLKRWAAGATGRP